MFYMKIIFLGTGTSQGVPVIGVDDPVCHSVDFRDKRLRSSVLVEVGGKTIVIDTGPDFRQQMLRERVSHLDAVLFTHQHKDHTAGLDDIRSFYFRQGHNIPVYATDQVIRQLHQEYAYMFAEHKYPGVASVDIHRIQNNVPFHVGDIEIIPVEVLHHRLPVLGFRIGDFTYITDAKTIVPEELEKIKGSKVVVLNALQKTPHISHFTLDEALAVARQIGVEQTYLTHISYRLGFHREVSKELPHGVALAYDGLKISI